MFGIAKPCRHNLSPALYQEWVGHQCGLCLTLREHHGQGARLTTNTDAIVLSVLTAAQHPAGVQTVTAAPCPLRGMRTAIVVAPGDPAAVHAAAVSLTMAATKVADHALDGDGLPGRVPRLAIGVSRRWAGQGDDLASLVDFDTDAVRDAVARSNERERERGRTFDEYVEPTEDAAGAACRHTAVIARCRHNADALDELGRMFGRITYLFDAVDDEVEDVASGHFNALVECYPDPVARREAARALFDDAHARLTAAFDRLELCRPELARALLVDQLRRAGHQRFHHTRTCAVRGRGHHHEDAAARGHGHDQGQGQGHDHAGAHGHRPHGLERRRPRPVRLLADVGLTAVAALGVTFAVFRPENQPGGPVGQGGPMFDPNAMPGGGYPNQFTPGPNPPKQHWWNGCCDGVDCCDGADCCCCCCEADGCCDSCDCGCDC